MDKNITSLIDVIKETEAGYLLGFCLFFHILFPNPQICVVPTLLTMAPFSFQQKRIQDDKLYVVTQV
jgi:hypothetical protein